MLRQKGLTGARARRRGLSDSALGETRRQLGYKTGWYGSRLVVADRWYPSSVGSGSKCALSGENAHCPRKSGIPAQ
jgi:transposase